MAVTTSKIVSGYEDPDNPGEVGPVADLDEIAGGASAIVYAGVTRDKTLASISAALTAAFSGEDIGYVDTDDHVVSTDVVSVTTASLLQLTEGKVWPLNAAAPYAWALVPSLSNYHQFFNYTTQLDTDTAEVVRQFVTERRKFRIAGVLYDLLSAQLPVSRPTGNATLDVVVQFGNPTTPISVTEAG